jgi:hypothetical protein
MPVLARPSDALLAWLSSVSDQPQARGMTPVDLALFRASLPVARRLLVFSDPFVSADADADVDALERRFTNVERSEIFYMLGIAVGLELAGSLSGLAPEHEEGEGRA